MLFDTVLAFDHAQHRLLLIANARITADDDLEALYQFACARIQFLETELERSLSGGKSPAGGAVTLRSNLTKEQFESDVRTAKEHIAAGDIYQVVLVAALRGRRHRRPVHRLPRAATREPVAVHVLPPARQAGHRRRLARDARAGRGAPRADASHCRHAPTRRDHRRGSAAGRGAQAQREGARRARDARRSRTQRPGTRVRLRHRARAAVHDARALLARHAPGLDRRRAAGRGHRPARRAGVVLPGGHRVGRAQGARDGDHRGPRADHGAGSTPAPSATSTLPATSTSASPSAPS